MANSSESKQEVQKRIYDHLAKSPLLWGKTFFPHHFRMDSPKFHSEMINAAMSEIMLSVAAPRESAKSTTLIFLYPFHGIMFKRFHFIVLVSNTFKKASMHLDSIKKELADNQALKETFPGITIVRDAEGDSEFRHPDGFTVKFLCKGVDQIGSIRGVKFGAYRPDLILCDDMEDDELVKNPLRRRDLQAEYDEALIPAGERGKVQIINVGTILHDDCQMAKLISDKYYPEFKKLIYKAHLNPGNKNEASLWPQKWTLDWLNYMRTNKPTVYAKELQNDPVSGVSVRFTREMFRKWRIVDGKYQLLDYYGNVVGMDSLKSCKAAISCDLAWEEDKDADSCVLMPGLLTPDSNILVYPYLARKGVRPTNIIEFLFTTVERLERMTGSSVPVGFEKAMLEKVTRWILRQEMKKRNKFIVTKSLSWEGDKIERIEIRLEPRYAQNAIYHMEGMGDLEFELERFPSGAHDDLPDALQGLVQMLENPKAKQAAEKDDMFMKMRRITIEAKKKAEFHGFGSKLRRHRGLPFRKSPF